MTIGGIFKAAIIGSAILVSSGCVNQEDTASASQPVETAATNESGDWLSTVTLSDRGGHILGDPDAPTKITEFVSYTCGHCSDFERDGVPKIQENFVASGAANFEIRNLMLNPVDLTVATLARCGPADRFFVRHKFWLKTQTEWVLRTGNFGEKTRALVRDKDNPKKQNELMLSIYEDMGLSQQAAKIGLADSTAKKCLANKETPRQLNAMRKEALEELGVTGTPSFLVNGELAKGAHSYDVLEPFLTSKTGT